MADDKTICPLRYLTNTFGGQMEAVNNLCVIESKATTL